MVTKYYEAVTACGAVSADSFGNVSFRDGVTAEEKAAVEAIRDSWDFSTNDWRPGTPQKIAADREAAIASIDADYAAQQETGVTLASGIRMRSVQRARDDYAQLSVMALLTIAAEGDNSLTWWDADGNYHTSTPGEWCEIAAEYARLCAAQRYEYESRRAAA